jgi:hypothetical protein
VKPAEILIRLNAQCREETYLMQISMTVATSVEVHSNSNGTAHWLINMQCLVYLLPLLIFVAGRGDFVGGIDNEALDFSQLEDFINDENDASNK